MKRLALEAATELCSVALDTGTELMVRREWAPRRHGALLLPWARSLLADAGLRWSDLDGVAVGTGPGSFTGVRLALSLAQGLALARDLPVYPVSTLAALAHAGRPAGYAGPVLACLDARMGEVYAGLYEWQVGRPRLRGAEAVLAPEQVKPPGQEPVFGAGSGFAVDSGSLPTILGARLSGYDSRAMPDARAVAELASFVPPVDATRLEPVYLRNRVTRT